MPVECQQRGARERHRPHTAVIPFQFQRANFGSQHRLGNAIADLSNLLSDALALLEATQAAREESLVIDVLRADKGCVGGLREAGEAECIG